MSTTSIQLDPAHEELLRSLAEQTGKPADTVVQDGLDLLAQSLRLEHRRQTLERVAGLWKDREDLPDWDKQRKEMDERLDRIWGSP